MLPFIFGGIALVGAGVAAYRYFAEDDKVKPVVNVTPVPRTLGTFIVWGRPNTGKTTFIAGLRGVPAVPGVSKEATTSRTTYTDVLITGLDRGPHIVKEIADMPGTKDRLPDWLKHVKNLDHVFYLVNLARVGESTYLSSVRSDIAQTITALKDSSKQSKRLNIIGSHVDESEWREIAASEVNNVLQEDERFRMLYESMDGVAGYVYAANLTNSDSFKQLLQSIANDILAQK